MIFKTQSIEIKSEKELQEIFEKSNKDDFFSHGNMNNLFEEQKRFLISNLNLTSQDNVLDLACGYGLQLTRLSNLINHGVGIDWAKKMIDSANRMKIKNHISNINFPILESTNLSIQITMQLKKTFIFVYLVRNQRAI